MAAAVVASTPALICVVDADGRLVLFNPALEGATGWSSAEVLGRPFWDVLVVEHEVELAKDCVVQAMATGTAPSQEGDWLDRWGGRRRVWMHNCVLRDEHGRPNALVFVGIDVTDQRILEAQLRRRATYDALTGLPNRDTLLLALRDELDDARSAGCGVLFCDLDRFKLANDTHGHEIGDLLLREVAARMLAAVGPADVVARFGGDEFVVLCRGADAHRTASVRSQVEAAVARPFTTAQGLVDLGVSIGVAVGVAGDSVEHLIAAADRHMYGVKTARRDARDAAR